MKLRRAFSGFARRPVATTHENRTHIQLQGLPRTALPADIQRAIARGKLRGVLDVAIDYNRFIPTGRATLTLANSDMLNPNLLALENATISSIPITASSAPWQPTGPKRWRGGRGRVEAAERGLITGDGPRGGVVNEGKTVVIWGLPGRLTPESLSIYVQNFNLAGTEGGKKEVVKIEGSDGVGYTRFSKHLIRLSSMAEAHRLVRALHMTYFQPGVHQNKYLIRCRVVY